MNCQAACLYASGDNRIRGLDESRWSQVLRRSSASRLRTRLQPSVGQFLAWLSSLLADGGVGGIAEEQGMPGILFAMRNRVPQGLEHRHRAQCQGAFPMLDLLQEPLARESLR